MQARIPPFGPCASSPTPKPNFSRRRFRKPSAPQIFRSDPSQTSLLASPPPFLARLSVIQRCIMQIVCIRGGGRCHLFFQVIDLLTWSSLDQIGFSAHQSPLHSRACLNSEGASLASLHALFSRQLFRTPIYSFSPHLAAPCQS